MALLSAMQCPRQSAERGPIRDGNDLYLAGESRPHITEMRIVDPVCDSSWDRLVLSHPNHNLFHRAAWARVLWRTYGHRPIYLHFYREGESVGLVPIMEVASPFTGRRGVALPFSDFCSPLAFNERGQESLMPRLLELGRKRKWRYFELRGGRENFPASTMAAEKYYGHSLDLTIGPENVFARFKDSVRRAIRKAEKSGVTVEESHSRAAMLDFYRLHVRTRRRHGLPPQPLSFFLNIHEEIVKPDLGFVILGKLAARTVGAAIFFYSGEAALFKFGASDERAQQVRGNNLIMWEGIRRLAEKRLKTLHFGRTSLTNDGLRRFKLSWGSEEELIEYFRVAFGTNKWLNPCHNASEFHSRLFRKLPLVFNRLAGTLIYPHLD